MHRGEFLFFLLVVGIFSIDFFKVRTGLFFDSSTLPPKITQWELDSCTRTISVQAVAGGIPPYDFYVFKQDPLDLSSWQVYRLIKEQLPQISSLPPGTYRIKAVNEGVTSPSFATNTLEVNFPADSEIEVKGTTSLCSGSSTAIALHLADSEVSLPIRWTAQVLLAPEGGELLGYTSNPLTPLLEITDTLINTGRTLAKVSYQLQALINGCLLPARTVEVQVNPVPRIEATVSDSLICSGTPFSISLLPKSWGASPMQLRRTATLLSGQVIGLEQGNPSPQAVLSSITQTLVNRGTGPARIRYTFYPSFNGCDGVAEIVEVVLLPEPQVTQQADLISCAGEWVSVPEFNSNLPSDSLAYSWEVSDSSLGLSSGTGNRIPDFQAINSSPGFKRALVRVTPMLYSQGISCPGSPFSFSITVRPPLVVKEELSNYAGFGVSCAGAADGKIKLDLSGGILSDEEPSYRYSWTGPEGFVSTSANLDGLQAGLYHLQVSTGLGNCLLEKSMVLTQPERLQISQSQVNNLCYQGNAGRISIRVSGGNAPYSYAWTGPNGFISTSEDLQNLASGSYQVTVTNANGCTITGATQTITEPSPLALIQNKLDNSCFQGGIGSITVIAAGGTAPYSYAWTGPNNFSSTVANPQNLVSGNYQVSVTDANGCTITGAAQTITEPSPLALNQVKVDNSCFLGSTGNITVTASEGTAPYSYAWTGPNNFSSTVANPQNLASGTYQVTVTDATGCTITGATQTITEPSPLALIQNKLDNSCFQGRKGKITVTVSGGTAPYSYAWMGSNEFVATTKDLQNLASGNYQVTVTDANGCTITGAPQTITEPSPLGLNQVKVENPCAKGASGSITVSTFGGKAPYSYAWTGPNGFIAITEDLQNLASGTYQVTITDANGCTITGAPQMISEPSPIALNQVKVNNPCAKGASGSITVSTFGGKAPYSYAWTGPNGFIAITEDLQNLASGTYQVTITDANGCTITGAPQMISEPAPLTLIAQVQAETCADAKDGRIEVIPTGGLPPYQIRWEHGLTGPVATGLGAGTYRLTVTDQGGCTQTAEYSLLPVPALRLEGTVTYQATQVPLQISAFLQSDAQGGTPPFTYRWNSGQTTPSLTVVESGTYTLQLKDANGCVQEKEFAVALPLPLSIAVAVAMVPLCEEQGQETTLQLSISHGLAPYQITWTMGSIKASGMQFTTRESGLVEVEVRDALGLVEKRAITIPPRQTGPLDFAHLFASQPQFQADLAGFKGVFRPFATWPHQVLSWDFGDGTSSSESSPTHTYTRKGRYTVTLTVLDAEGCLIKVSKEVQILDFYLEIPNVFTPNGDLLNDSFFPKFRFIQSLQLQVMNNWGELIYRSQGQEGPGWDGTVAGQKAPEGVYVYKISYQVPDGRVFTFSSTFLLAR